MKRTLLSLCLLAALGASAPAHAADPALEARLKALEERVATLQTELEATRDELNAQKSTPVADAGADAATEAPAPSAESVAADEGAGASAASGPNLMNPAITLILNGQYTHGGPGPQGLSLGESELVMSANIDDKFYGQLAIALESEDGVDEVGIEEAYLETTALPNGLALRAGRFLSNIGYLNHHHAHTDKFADRPLAYQAFLGEAYRDDGVHLRWVAPTDTYAEFGGELLRGQNFPSGGAAHGGVGARTLFAHFGGDVGAEASWLAGVSVLDSHTEGGEDGFSGKLRLYIADATWKWAPDGNTKDGGLTLRGEYFVEHRDGAWTNPDDELDVQAWDGTRRGAYVEGIWRIDRQWEAGYRYDRLWSGEDGPFAFGDDPQRHSLVLSWLNSEFSLLRLQLSRGRAPGEDSDTALTLQYQATLGAHGAHKF